MKTLIGAIQSFITHFLAVGMITSGLLLVAGEIRLAALKKASQGSSKLSPFTERMTGMKVNDILK
jgi:uncharacterized membrane protein